MNVVRDGAKEEPVPLVDELPATPIRSRLALWVPRAATVGCLGLTFWGAQRSEGLHGVSALVFPFLGTSNKERWEASYLTWNLTSPFLIWIIEGYRGGSSMTPLALPSLFGAAVQVFGITSVAPIYYIYSACTGIGCGGAGRVDPDVARAILPATIIGHVLPGILMSMLPMTATEISRSHFSLQSIVCHLFYLSPITVSVLTKGISTAVKWFRGRPDLKAERPVGKETLEMNESDHYSPEPSALKTAYATAIGLQALYQIFDLARLMRGVWDVVGQFPSEERLFVVTEAAKMAVQEQSLGSWALKKPLTLYRIATFVFGMYTVWDLRRRGYATSREATWAALSFWTGSELCGVGAGYAGLWYWRESVLDRLWHRATPSTSE